MKAIFELPVDFTGIVVMCSAEGKAVVQKNSQVRYVETSDAEGEIFSKRFAKRKVKRSVAGKVVVGIRWELPLVKPEP